MKSHALALGATKTEKKHTFRIYIPSHDKHGNRIAYQQKEWLARLGRVLTEIAGGMTAMPAVGSWFDHATGQTVWEAPIIMMAHIDPTHLQLAIGALREELHTMGRDMKQSAVAFELDNQFHLITQFDKQKEVLTAA